MLQRQEKMEAPRQFSVKAPLSLVRVLQDYALGNRVTQSAAITQLLKKALAAESGEPYVPEPERRQNRESGIESLCQG